ncbi:MAG: GNAT family N-acetyltransferase [Rhodospirillaceae bacterium]|nr:GNAT family N-acetyltransferase [Rhodospirillaceae bacterium]
MEGALSDLVVSEVTADAVEERLEDFAALMHACVLGGASINFVLPFSRADSAAFWRAKVLPSMRSGLRRVWAAEVAGQVAGSVQLSLDTPPNQPHRADVAKLLVRPDFRRRGIARALMAALESAALALGRRLITLDTATGHSAEPLYLSLGYQVLGIIPDYCRDTIEDRMIAATFLHKVL